MDMEVVRWIAVILAGLAAAIPAVMQLIAFVKKAVKEKNWGSLVSLVLRLMTEAETMFHDGASRKEWVMNMVKESAQFINYDIDMESISILIDSLCAMSKRVNNPAVKAGD